MLWLLDNTVVQDTAEHAHCDTLLAQAVIAANAASIKILA